VSRRKYSRGSVIQGNWIFGGTQIDIKEMFVVFVTNRGIETLFKVFREFIEPVTVVMSDC
jgi:hypothetical protein